MKLDNIVLACGNYSELTEAHLKHHIFSQEYFLSNHDKCSGGRPDISEVELASALRWRLLAVLLDVFYLTVAPTDKALRDDDVVACRVPAKGSPILADNVDIIQKLPLHSLQDQDVSIFYLVQFHCILI